MVAEVYDCDCTEEVAFALDAAERWFRGMVGLAGEASALECLRRVADLYEENVAELTAITTREAGKMVLDGIAEVREAVDFLRYYANEAERLDG